MNEENQFGIKRDTGQETFIGWSKWVHEYSIVVRLVV